MFIYGITVMATIVDTFTCTRKDAVINKLSKIQEYNFLYDMSCMVMYNISYQY